MLDACLGSHASAAGRNRNGRFVEHDGDEPTPISGMADGLMAIYLIGRITERPTHGGNSSGAGNPNGRDTG